MTRRLLRLLIGLVIYGIGCAVLVQAGVGLDPWTVLAEGLAIQTGIGIGWIVVLLGGVVLVLWIPLRQRPGVGTVANILVVGTVMQGALGLIPRVEGFIPGVLVFLVGIALIAAASGIYIGADLGPGPRDGLMTGLNARLGWPIWVCRFVVEGTVLLTGWILGGTVGLGTVLFATLIGPCVHLALAVSERASRRRMPRAVAAV
ncbi:YitT family protein [Microbacterium sp. 179-B 1A2 NHS]|uniref:membrane protein YczE n=1 Tax=Microbacterium sp. 179-B 1A2 NHS TaxID=3142383 RepID=UPI0039A2FAD0